MPLHPETCHRKVCRSVRPRIRELCKMFLRGEIPDSVAERKLFSIWYESGIWADYKFGYNGFINKADMKCAFSGKSPTVVFIFEPKNIDQLACVCGCAKEDLPEQIQHWGEKKGYDGNHLLERLDPLSYMIDDPFQKLRFRIAILVSKTEYLAICEEAGVEKDKFWENEKPSCFIYREGATTCKGKYSRDYISTGYAYLKKCEKCKYFEKKEK